MSKRDDDNHTDDASWSNIDFNEIELGDRIGGGGAGIIYQGYFRDKPVALKTLFDSRVSAELKQEYMDELLVMSKVKHSNIVTFLGACMIPPNLCFIMELCESSLFDIIHVKKTQFSMQDNFQIMIDVASAMEYLHSLSPAIIHRDLKSPNILRSTKGIYKVCDFGLVKVKNNGAGTPAYMPPELIDKKPYNKSVDVYSFAVLIWEIVTAEIPFKMIDRNEICQRTLSGVRLHIPSYGFTLRLKKLVEACWDQQPENRPNFTAIVDELIEMEKIIPQVKHTENVKDSIGDALDGLLSHNHYK